MRSCVESFAGGRSAVPAIQRAGCKGTDHADVHPAGLESWCAWSEHLAFPPAFGLGIGIITVAVNNFCTPSGALSHTEIRQALTYRAAAGIARK